MKTHKFARKPFYVDAVRVSEANIHEVADWCEGTVETGRTAGQSFIKVKVHRPLTDRQTEAYLGDWVLFAGTGFKVYTTKAFDKSFEKVKTLTKAQADEAGIRVPHEKRPTAPQRPVPTPPAKKPEGVPVFADEKGPEGYEPGDLVDVVRRSKADIEADKLISEVLREEKR